MTASARLAAIRKPNDVGYELESRVLIKRRGHPWFGRSGVLEERVDGNPYISYSVNLDNGARAGVTGADIRVLTTPAKKRVKR